MRADGCQRLPKPSSGHGELTTVEWTRPDPRSLRPRSGMKTLTRPQRRPTSPSRPSPTKLGSPRRQSRPRNTTAQPGPGSKDAPSRISAHDPALVRIALLNTPVSADRSAPPLGDHAPGRGLRLQAGGIQPVRDQAISPPRRPSPFWATGWRATRPTATAIIQRRDRAISIGRVNCSCPIARLARSGSRLPRAQSRRSAPRVELGFPFAVIMTRRSTSSGTAQGRKRACTIVRHSRALRHT